MKPRKGNPLGRKFNGQSTPKSLTIPIYTLCVASYYIDETKKPVRMTAAIYNTKTETMVEVLEFLADKGMEQVSDEILALSKKYHAPVFFADESSPLTEIANGEYETRYTSKEDLLKMHMDKMGQN